MALSASVNIEKFKTSVLIKPDYYLHRLISCSIVQTRGRPVQVFLQPIYVTFFWGADN